MTKTGFRFFALLLCLSLCSCRQKSSPTTADTRIEWRKANRDFGNITAGEEVSHTFYYKNTGSHPLILKKTETGCGCTTVNYDQAPLAPGEEGKIEIVFNSKGRFGKQYKEIRIFANIPEKYSTLSFTANIKE